MWILNHYLIRDSEYIIFIYRMQLLINRHYKYHIFHNSSFLNNLELYNTHVKIEVHTFYRFSYSTIHFSGYKWQYIFCYHIVWLLSTCLHLLQFLKKWKQSWLLDFVLLTVAQMYQKLVFSGGCSRMEKVSCVLLFIVDSHIIYIEVGFVFGEEAKWKEEGKFSVDIFAFGT